MKKAVMVAVSVAAAVAFADALTPTQKSFLAGRRIVTARDTTTIQGSVITTWSRDGKVESVITNRLAPIVGVKQANPMQALYIAATNAAAMKQARIDSFISHLKAQRDAAKLSATKAIYQALIDKIED